MSNEDLSHITDQWKVLKRVKFEKMVLGSTLVNAFVANLESLHILTPCGLLNSNIDLFLRMD